MASTSYSFAKELLEGLEKEDPSAIWLLKDIFRSYVRQLEEEVEPSEETEEEGDEEDDQDSSSESPAEEEEPKRKRSYK